MTIETTKMIRKRLSFIEQTVAKSWSVGGESLRETLHTTYLQPAQPIPSRRVACLTIGSSRKNKP